MSIENDCDHFPMFTLQNLFCGFLIERINAWRHGWGRLKSTLTLANVKNTFIVEYSLNYIYNYIYNENIISRISCL